MRKQLSVSSKIGVFLGLILMTGLFSFNITLADELDRDFIAGMPKNFPPHFFIDAESGKPTGFGVDVMDTVARRCGITVKYRAFESWKETNQAAKDGLIDIIPNMGFTSERKVFTDFIQPYETFRINYYIRVTSSSLKSSADIGTQKIGVVGTSKARFILEKKGHHNLVKVNSYEDLTWKLIAGDVDCIVMPKPVMDYLMKKSGLTDHILTLGDPLVEIKRGIAVAKGRKELVQLLQSTMGDFILSQDFKDIYTKWYGQPEPYWTPKRLGIVGALLFCSTFFAVVFWRYRFINRINKELEITVHERTKKIEESEKRYRQMFLGNQAIKLLIDPIDGRIIEANDAACNFYQYPKHKLLSMKISDINTLAPEKLQEEMAAAMDKDKGHFFFSHKLSNGEIRDVEVFSGPVNVGDNTLLFSIIHDISKRKKAEKAVLKEKAISEEYINSLPGLFYVFDEKRFVKWNSEWNRISGYSDEELSVKYGFDFFEGQDRVLIKDAMHKVFVEGSVEVEAKLVTKDGRKIPYYFTGLRKKLRGTPHLIGLGIDITERKQIESKLRQSQKMESIGNLAGGIAHDFNNILSSVIGFTELSLGEAGKGSVLEDNLQEVYSAGKRAKELVNQILAFARQSEDDVKPIQPSVIAKEVLKLIRSSIPTTIEIKQMIESDSFVMGNPTQIHQVVMNLCTNAFYAMEDGGGILEITMKDIFVESGSTQNRAGVRTGDYIQIMVSDTGTGIPPEILHSIFEPYFTTKRTGEGTGMGLAVVQGIVESYGGKIIVDSIPGKGSTFNIYIPITKKRKFDRSYKPEYLPSGTEKILFVDDEASIAKMGGRILEELGYYVETRTSSVEALELFKSKLNEFDLVISDVTMPNMTGDVLATELMTIRPDIPVILCTGYSKKITDETAYEIGIKAFTYKPIVKADLAKTIRKVLDEAKR